MNTIKVAALRAAINANDITPFVGAHHTHIKEAVKDPGQRAKLARLYAKAGLDAPAWLQAQADAYEAEARERLVVEAPALVVGETPIQAIKRLAGRNTLWGEVLTGAETIQGLGHRLNKMAADGDLTARRKDGTGYQISPVRKALGELQLVMDRLSGQTRAFQQLGHIEYDQAVTLLDAVYNRLSFTQQGFAAFRGNENHRELVYERLTLKTLSGDFDAFQPGGAGVTYEEYLDAQDSLDPTDVWLVEQYEMQQAEYDAQDNGHRAGSGRPGSDEGRLRETAHDARTVLDVPYDRIPWADYRYADAALFGLSWPATLAGWEPLLDRVAEVTANAAGWESNPEAAAAIEAKGAKRLAALEAPLDALGGYGRWAVNYACRRTFRDLYRLRQDQKVYLERLDRLEAQARAEQDEWHPAPAQVLRHRDEAHPFDREYKAPWGGVLTEAEMEFATGARGHRTQYEADKAWFERVLERIEDSITQIKELRAALLAIEDKLTVLWAISENGPKSAPVYWNNKGPFLTEDEAYAALAIEANEVKARVRAAEGDAFLQAAILADAENH